MVQGKQGDGERNAILKTALITGITGQDGWLSDEDWHLVQSFVPIVCVDLLPVSRGRFGLILRDTPHQGQRWCLAGGRLLRNESIAHAIDRQSRETFTIPCSMSFGESPVYVAEYFTDADGDLHDPRQHAIGLTYAVELCGEPQPIGEAEKFGWFAFDRPLPECGFGHERIVRAVIERIGGVIG